ncbi:MAG: polymer-forming cytoskeletal protein [Chloroflexi bacterium]|uniref:Polymer-forming cytoskeletal protein n=1 Tax=Candidatus Chlorohelix allophototropha TaxID=3003348 RepID=A0A8T7LVQ4_9CHLR|nr:polymer-forming cytoskeletal protein [Chloroflexota bacterium]WJW65483.1 polymer-forming cytoskeletal protein [Chloroflexota bacterium L227-S17]
MARMFGGNQSRTGNELSVPQGSNIKPDEHIETSIGSTASLKGELKAEGSIRIDGFFEGHIETAANVIIGPTGKVMADIKARNVLVAGRIKGNIEALERVEVLNAGGVLGDIDCPKVFLEEGAIFKGQVRMPQIPDEEEARFLLESPNE